MYIYIYIWVCLIYSLDSFDKTFNVCQGDSGGPVLRNGSVVAVSRGTCPRTGECDLPVEILNTYKFNIHVGIHSYKEFITDVRENF